MSKKALFLLVLTIALGAFLRLYRFESTLILDADQAVPFLLANRIIHHNHVLLTGPITALENVNVLPPTYYYIITGLYALLKNELTVVYAFSILGVLSIPMIFLFGNLLFGAKTGLIAALLYSMSATMVAYARNIWEPHPIPFFTILTFILLVYAHVSKKRYILLFSIVSFDISLMYISSFLLIPSYLLSAILVYKSINKNIVRSVFTVFFTFILLTLLQFFPVILFEINHSFPSLTALSKIFIRQNSPHSSYINNVIQTVIINIQLFTRSLFISDINFYLFAFVTPFTLFITRLLHKLITSNRRLVWLFLTFCSGIAATAIYQQDVQAYRMSSLYPLAFLIFAYLYKKLYVLNKKSSLPLYFILILILYQYMMQNISVNIYFITAPNKKPSETPYTIARYILDSAKNESFTVYVIDPKVVINSQLPRYIYAIEKITDKTFGTLTGYGNWFNLVTNEKVRWVFLICQRFSVRGVEQTCKKDFERAKNMTSPIETKMIDNIWIFKYFYGDFKV